MAATSLWHIEGRLKDLVYHSSVLSAEYFALFNIEFPVLFIVIIS